MCSVYYRWLFVLGKEARVVYLMMAFISESHVTDRIVEVNSVCTSCIRKVFARFEW